MASTIRTLGAGLQGWVHARPEHWAVVSMRDDEFRPGELTTMGRSAFRLATSAGNVSTGCAELMDVAWHTLRPDIIVSPCPPLGAAPSKSKVQKMAKRTLQLLDECAEALGDARDDNECHLFGSVLLCATDARTTMFGCRLLAQRTWLAGYWFWGIETQHTMAQLANMLQPAMSELMSEKPCGVHGMLAPWQIMACVQAGCDVFECTLADMATLGHHVLSFPVDPLQSPEPHQRPLTDVSVADAGEDTDPLLPGCTCVVCAPQEQGQHFQRGYVHHLLHVRELLGPRLLHQHNVHHLHACVQAMRAHMEQGRGPQLLQAWQAYETRWSATYVETMAHCAAKAQRDRDAKSTYRSHEGNDDDGADA